jgi:hypothetical protein
MSVLYYMLSGRRLYDSLITRPEEFYRVWCVWMRCRNPSNEALAYYGCQVMSKNVIVALIYLAR